MSEKGKLELQKPLHAQPELQPRQRLEKLLAIMEYANAAGSFAVSVGVAADEIRTAALIWDTDRRQESCAQSTQSGKGVRLVLIRQRCSRPATRPRTRGRS